MAETTKPQRGELVVKVFGALIGAVGVFFVIDIPAWLGLQIFSEQYLAFFLYSILALVFLSGARRSSFWLRSLDGLLALGCLVVASATIIAYSEWVSSLGVIEPQKIVVGLFGILLVLEAIRRTTGLFLVLVISVFIVYASIAEVLPASLRMLNTSWDRIVVYLFLDPNSLLGSTLWIGATLAFAFVLFGQVIHLSGAGDAINRLAVRLLGRYRGGPAYAAIVASGSFGGFTGSVTADIYVTGTFTIPMMRRVGFRPEVAAGIEAASATGAGIMPPVMDPGAFLLAQNVGLPYPKVALAALLPALMYYLALFASVRTETERSNISAMSIEELPPAHRNDSLLSWTLLSVSFAALIYTLFILYLNPALSAIYASIPAVGLILMRRGLGMRGRLGAVIEILYGTVLRLRDLTPIVGGAGLLIGMISLTGLGTTVTSGMVNLAQGNAIALLAVTVIVIVILGMGMPPFVVYAICAVILAPALIQLRVEPLVAHLFILYWSLFAQFTPPVCIAAIVAANVAGTNTWRTAWQTIRIGMMAFVIPFVFFLKPALLLNGTFVEILFAAATSFIGIWIFVRGAGSALYDRHVALRLMGVARAILAVGLLHPSWTWAITSTVLLLILWLLQRLKGHANRALKDA